MDDVTRQAADIGGSIRAYQEEAEQCRKEADALEAKAREQRARAFECKRLAQQAQVALSHQQVKARVESDEALAAKARAEAESHLKETVRLRGEAEGILARLKEAAPKEAAPKPE